MFSKRYRRITFVALVLLLWLASIAYRNRNNPQVRHLSWKKNGPICTVECELWNPQDRPVYVRTTMRVVNLTDGESPTMWGEEKEFIYQIDAKSHLKVKEQLRHFPSGTPEVRAFLIPPPADPSAFSLPPSAFPKTAETDSGYRAAQR